MHSEDTSDRDTDTAFRTGIGDLMESLLKFLKSGVVKRLLLFQRLTG